MTELDVAFLGFGNVGRALAALLDARRAALASEHDVVLRVTGVATRRGGWWADPRGLEPAAPRGTRCAGIDEWLARARPRVVFETLPLDPHGGQPALDLLRAVLAAGAHAISANKGPVVHGYDELRALAAAHGVAYRFESAVMDGAPVFSLVRHGLPLAGLTGVRGLFTSTAELALHALARGDGLVDGIAAAQRLGIAESDPRWDVDGWDTVVKLCAVARVVFGVPLGPADVAREGIGALDPEAARAAAAAGAPYRLVGRLARDAHGALTARVAPERVAPGDPLAAAHGTDLVMCWEAEVFPGGLTVISGAPDTRTTAYGMLADLVEIVGAR